AAAWRARAFVAARSCPEEDIAGAEGWHEELLEISAEAGAVDRAVDDAGRGDAVVAQRRQKGQRAPAALRHLGDQAGPAAAAPVPAGHVWLWPGLVDENHALWGQAAPMRPPPGPAGGKVGRVLPAWVSAFFKGVPLYF